MSGFPDSWPIPPGRRRFYAKLGRIIKQARIDSGLTQVRLAARMKMSRPSIANIEAGRQSILLHHASAFAKVLKIDKMESLP
jgi:transcriptional regulator with XRE-family HTH domain